VIFNMALFSITSFLAGYTFSPWAGDPAAFRSIMISER